jgi:hypothetical protein
MTTDSCGADVDDDDDDDDTLCGYQNLVDADRGI